MTSRPPSRRPSQGPGPRPRAPGGSPRDGARPAIAGGSLRGLRLAVPRGGGVRPTRAMLREALFSMLAGRVEGRVALDLYAGSGALGLEALSRGAASCVFVERAPLALEALRSNLEAARLPSGRALVVAGDVSAFDPAGRRFGLVLADPPYALPEPLPAWLRAPDALADDAWLALEIPSARLPPRNVCGLELQRSRTHGASTLCLYARDP